MAMVPVNLPEDKLKPSKLERALSMIQMAGSLADMAGSGSDLFKRLKEGKGTAGMAKAVGLKTGPYKPMAGGFKFVKGLGEK